MAEGFVSVSSSDADGQGVLGHPDHLVPPRQLNNAIDRQLGSNKSQEEIKEYIRSKLQWQVYGVSLHPSVSLTVLTLPLAGTSDQQRPGSA
jgi:hypothetical protein